MDDDEVIPDWVVDGMIDCYRAKNFIPIPAREFYARHKTVTVAALVSGPVLSRFFEKEVIAPHPMAK